MALQAISYFCTMPILFHKSEGFPGKMSWELPVTLAVTKPGLWRSGLHLDSTPVSAAQATSGAERVCERQLHSKPGIPSVRQSHCTASSQPGSLKQHKNVLKPRGLPQESWSRLLSALCAEDSLGSKSATSLAWWLTAEIPWLRSYIWPSAIHFQNCLWNTLLLI